MMLLFLACTDYSVKENLGAAGVDVRPEIVLTPDALEFAALAPGDAEDASFTLTNEGNADLHLGRVALAGSTAFTLGDDPSDQILVPGASVELPVRFSPINPEEHADLHVESDDPDEPSLVAPLTGGGLFPVLAVVPTRYDFGSVPYGCTADVPITLTNVGTADLTVTAADALGEGFSTVALPDLPLVLAPGAYATVTGGYAPEGAADAGMLWVSSDDPFGMRGSAWTGNGTEGGAVTDEFLQGSEVYRSVNIDIFVDRSCSMSDDAANLAANFGTFHEALTDAGLKWNLMVTNGDDGCQFGGFYTDENPDDSGFERSVLSGGGTWTEAGLTVTSRAMEESLSGGCNEGFLVPGASTILVLVSDEPEQSARPWNEYVDTILAVVPDAKIVSIVGDLPRGCASAAPGEGYVEAAEATGGTFLSICATDWGEFARGISTLSSSSMRASFVLSDRPEPSTLAVTVNGIVNTQWTYEPYGNAVIFYTDRLPPADSVIDVRYDLAGTCER